VENNAETPNTTRGFASDNHAGAHPEVMDAILQANVGHVESYGADPYSARFQQTVRDIFGVQAEAFPVFNGTGANVISLGAMLPRWGAVVCTETAHINVDEGGAPEYVDGIKLLTCQAPDGKLTSEMITSHLDVQGDPHSAQPLAVSVAQSTELGTTYTVDELLRLSQTAHDHGMLFHIDGSRLANAAAFLGCSLREISTDVGADILSLGGTKNGLLGAEAVVVLNPARFQGLEFLRKSHMQLASKMRFLTAQLNAMYGTDLWLRSAQHANAMAARLRAGIDEITATVSSKVAATQATQANGVFVTLPPHTAEAARQSFHFYDWPHGVHEVRLMCSFDTTPEDVDGLLRAIGDAASDPAN
jgi:threonine aldolase